MRGGVELGRARLPLPFIGQINLRLCFSYPKECEKTGPPPVSSTCAVTAMHLELSYRPIGERNVGLPDPVNDIRTQKTERKPNKSLQLSAMVVISKAVVSSRQEHMLGFRFGAATELYVRRRLVLSEHIVDTILSTSLTLFRATLSPRGEGDAVEGTVSDGREGKLHP
jgi:hypothetical protein